MRRALKIVLAAVAALAISVVALFVLLRPSPLFFGLPAATTGAFGHAGDPVNIAAVGDEADIVHAFLAAHWIVPDAITVSSVGKIVEASIANSAYPAAPMSNLYLFGRVQDLAFELPTDSVRQRHHVRWWQTAKQISGKPLWIGSASYDSGIELSGTTALPTHHVSPDMDAERDFLSNSLAATGLVQQASSARIGYPTLWGFNGGGDWYFDDGLVRVFTVR